MEINVENLPSMFFVLSPFSCLLKLYTQTNQPKRREREMGVSFLLGAWGLERIFSFGADDFMGMIKYI
jgi:hypothetical protein